MSTDIGTFFSSADSSTASNFTLQLMFYLLSVLTGSQHTNWHFTCLQCTKFNYLQGFRFKVSADFNNFYNLLYMAPVMSSALISYSLTWMTLLNDFHSLCLAEISNVLSPYSLTDTSVAFTCYTSTNISTTFIFSCFQFLRFNWHFTYSFTHIGQFNAPPPSLVQDPPCHACLSAVVWSVPQSDWQLSQYPQWVKPS